MDIYLQCVGVVVVVSRTPDPERVVTLAGCPAEAARVRNIVDIARYCVYIAKYCVDIARYLPGEVVQVLPAAGVDALPGPEVAVGHRVAAARLPPHSGQLRPGKHLSVYLVRYVKIPNDQCSQMCQSSKRPTMLLTY